MLAQQIVDVGFAWRFKLATMPQQIDRPSRREPATRGKPARAGPNRV